MSHRLYTIKTAFLTSVAGAALFAAAPASADSLTPLTFSGTVGVGGMIDITDKVGTISMGGPTTATADVLFIMDTTGSMSGEIGTVQSAFAGTVTALSALGTVATGAGAVQGQNRRRLRSVRLPAHPGHHHEQLPDANRAQLFHGKRRRRHSGAGALCA